MNSIPQLPEEIRAARIGTCYNAFTRKLMSTRNAIDPKKLEDGMVLFIPGTAELSVRANSSSTKNVQESFFALDSKAKVGPWATASYNMSLSSSEAKASSSLSCYCSYVYKDQKLQLMDQGPEALFNCMTDEFQKAYTNVVTAGNGKKMLEYYLEFVDRFGYGCVTGLHLSSGSAFEIQAHHESNAKAWEDKYNASAGIGFSFGGASVAVSYAKKGASADSDATVEITGVNYPENTPTRDWCNQYMTTLAGIAFKDLAEKAQTISNYSGDLPKAPDIPEGKKDEKKLPDGKMEDISEEMQQQLMDEDGFQGTWEAYCHKQKELLDSITPEKVAKEASNRLEEHLACDPSPLSEEAAPDFAVSASASAWDLGGFVPHHVDCTPWSELFPALAGIELPTGLHTLYLGKAYMYYMTRLQFVSYLNLLIDIGITPGTTRPEADRDACVAVCEKLLRRIETDLRTGTTFNEGHYDKIVTDFEKWLLKDWPDFSSRSLYTRFFKHYDFFYLNMSGFAYVVRENKKLPRELGEKYTYLSKNNEFVKFTENQINMQMLMQDCMRLYPVLPENEESDEAILYGYSTKGDSPGWFNLPLGWHISQNRQVDENGYACYRIKGDTIVIKCDIAIYAADEKTLRSLEGTPLAAVPMIPPLNFDDIYSFLGTDEEA